MKELRIVFLILEIIFFIVLGTNPLQYILWKNQTEIIMFIKNRYSYICMNYYFKGISDKQERKLNNLFFFSLISKELCNFYLLHLNL